MTETFTELDVDERRELLEKIEDVPFGSVARVAYYSSRKGSGVIERTGVSRARGTVRDEKNRDALYIETDELQGDIVVTVNEDHMENTWHSPIVAFVTEYRGRNRRGRLGELLDVEVVDG